jgi:hypothetical protein
MPTFSQLAQEYADYFRTNRASINIIDEMVNMIRGITIEKTGISLSSEEMDLFLINFKEALINPISSTKSGFTVRGEDISKIIEIYNLINKKVRER